MGRAGRGWKDNPVRFDGHFYYVSALGTHS